MNTKSACPPSCVDTRRRNTATTLSPSRSSMRPEQLRALLQTVFLLLFMPVLFFFGAGCLCNCGATSGSDYKRMELLLTQQTRDVQIDDGVVMRWHDLLNSTLVASEGEVRAAGQALSSSFIGIRIPSASDRNQPGQLRNPEIGYSLDGSYAFVELKPDPVQTDKLNALFPPTPGSQWVALIISDTHALDQVLDSSINTNNLNGNLSYQIDFGGTNPCNGCEVQLAGCLPGAFSVLLPPAVVATTKSSSDSSLVCSQPVSTHITLYDLDDNPLPGASVVAAFGLWGNLPTTSTVNGAVVLPLTLDHTGATTTTFDLAEIQSALGYTYTWENNQGIPVTQIVVGPRIHYPPPPTNLRVTAVGLPTCTQAVDVLDLRATHTVTPSIQAQTKAYISLLPDLATCAVADVAAHHLQHTDIIRGGQAITYTFTITNLTNSPVNATVEQTIAPAEAVRGADLPAGCSLAGAVVTCQVDEIAALGSKEVTVAILSEYDFNGALSSSIKARPVGASDSAFLDNVHGPLTATVQSDEQQMDNIYLPLISHE
jgi:hypothetical protein